MLAIRQAIVFALIASLLCWSGARAADTSADTTVVSFYDWYLHDLNNGQDPISTDPVTLSKYVAKSLIQEIKRKIDSPDGMERDYFIQAQDYMDDWLGHVTVVRSSQTADRGSVDVTLGRRDETKQRLHVLLLKEAGVWKIRHVELILPSGQKY
jgi:hypothetical protein